MVMEECNIVLMHYICGYSSVIDIFMCHCCVGDWEITHIKLWSCVVTNKSN